MRGTPLAPHHCARNGRSDTGPRTMRLTAIDWSGDAGDPGKSPPRDQRIVFAACHCDSQWIEQLVNDLLKLRQDWGRPGNYVFKHSNSSAKVIRGYCDVLARNHVEFTVLIINKSTWSPSYLRGTRGKDRIADAVTALVALMPEVWVADQKLIIDGNRSERRLLTTIRQGASRVCRDRDSGSFRKVAAVPDHRADAVLIQAADMVAGEVRQHGASLHTIPRSLWNRIKVIESQDIQKPHR